jgi:hypothetical protein
MLMKIRLHSAVEPAYTVRFAALRLAWNRLPPAGPVEITVGLMRSNRKGSYAPDTDRL